MMEMLGNLKISVRIYLALGLALAGLVIVAAIGIASLNTISGEASQLIEQEFKMTRAMSDLRGAVGNLRRYEKDAFINLANADKVASYRKKWHEALDKAYKAIDTATPLASSEAQTATLNTLKENVDAYAKGFNEVADRLVAGEFVLTSDANHALEPLKEPIRQIGDLVASVSDEVDASATATGDKLLGNARAASGALMIVTLVILALAGLLAFLIARSIIKPLLSVRDVASQIAGNHDLRLRAAEAGRNEIGDVVTALNTMVESTREVIAQVKNAVTETGQVSNEIGTMSNQVSASVNLQAENTASVAASLEELTVSINVVADSSHEVKDDSQQTQQESERAIAIARRTSEEIGQIAQSINTTSSAMDELNQRSTEIGGIVQVIKEIAEQTNLLALNAAIEAARAGEQGRGFAVVADEVRKLAERTTSATQEISTMIASVQTETKEADANMGAARDRISQGVEYTGQVLDALERIDAAAKRTVLKISEISEALKEQSAASTLIAQNVESIAQAGDENAAAAHSAQDSAAAMGKLARGLEVAANRFKV